MCFLTKTLSVKILRKNQVTCRKQATLLRFIIVFPALVMGLAGVVEIILYIIAYVIIPEEP